MSDQMITETVDLYGYYGQERNGAAGGNLTCWVQQTSAAVSSHRTRPAILILPGGGEGWEAYLDQEKLRYVPGLSAPLPQVCHPV